MRSVEIKLGIESKRVYFLGYQNENRATQIDLLLQDDMIDKNVYLEFQKPDGSKVLSTVLQINENRATYELTNQLTDISGNGKLQVTLRDNNKIYKTYVYNTMISNSINADNEIEPEVEDFITSAQDKLDQIDNVNITSERVIDGVNVTITNKEGEETTFKVNDGETGPTGLDGYTPVRGTDYWTENDKTEIINNVENDVIPELDIRIGNHNESGLSHADIRTLITLINSLIPNQATELNKLADKNFVNSSIATSTATFKGTYNNISEFPSTNIDDNDYVYYSHVDSAGNTLFDRYKYTSNNEWVYEYSLNNSGFTAEQWATINSGITALLVSQIGTNQNNIATILADYIKSTDYATSAKGGVIKIDSGYALGMYNGFLHALNRTFSQYSSVGDQIFISKGTLENVITGKNLETANNKVTSISSSSTDTEYPSAKCVYNAIDSINEQIGDISDALDLINGEII